MKKERLQRKKLSELRKTADSSLLAQLFDSCPLQGATGLAAAFGGFFPWMLDAGNGQAAHTFWWKEELCPQLQDYWNSKEFRPDKLFVPVDKTNFTFREVLRLLKEVDLLAAERKRAVAGYYCCFALFYGQKPKQSAHIEHTPLRYDLDKRIVEKFN